MNEQTFAMPEYHQVIPLPNKYVSMYRKCSHNTIIRLYVILYFILFTRVIHFRI